MYTMIGPGQWWDTECTYWIWWDLSSGGTLNVHYCGTSKKVKHSVYKIVDLYSVWTLTVHICGTCTAVRLSEHSCGTFAVVGHWVYTVMDPEQWLYTGSPQWWDQCSCWTLDVLSDGILSLHVHSDGIFASKHRNRTLLTTGHWVYTVIGHGTMSVQTVIKYQVNRVMPW